MPDRMGSPIFQKLEQIFFSIFTFTEVTSDWNNNLYNLEKWPLQAIFWGTFNTIKVVDGKEEKEEESLEKKMILKTRSGDNFFLSSCNPGICHVLSLV